MSDSAESKSPEPQPPKPDAPAEARPPPSTTASPSAAPAKPPRRRKWRRRLRLTFLTLLILFTLFRITLQIALPAVIRRTAAGYGLVANYERHEIDFFGGDVGIWHLVLSPSEGGD